MATLRSKENEERKKNQNLQKLTGQQASTTTKELLKKTTSSSTASAVSSKLLTKTSTSTAKNSGSTKVEQATRSTQKNTAKQASSGSVKTNLFDKSSSIRNNTLVHTSADDAVMSAKDTKKANTTQSAQASRETTNKTSTTSSGSKLFWGRSGTIVLNNNKDSVIANKNYTADTAPSQSSQLSRSTSVIYDTARTSQNPRDMLNAAILVGNKKLSQYAELDKTTQQKYGNIAYKKYLSGYKSAAEKMEENKLDYSLQKEFIDDYYRRFKPAVSNRTIGPNADSSAAGTHLSQLQSGLAAYLRQSNNMPDLKVYASYLEDIAKAKALSSSAFYRTSSITHKFDTLYDMRYSLLNQHNSLSNTNAATLSTGTVSSTNSDGRKIEDISAVLDSFMEENAQKLQEYADKHGQIQAKLYFYDNVKDGGDLDLKLQDDWKFEDDVDYYYHGTKLRYDDPGNINFGYVGSVLFARNTLCLGAGMNQMKKYGFQFGSLKTYYDDERDNAMIKSGYKLSKEGVWCYEGPEE